MPVDRKQADQALTDTLEQDEASIEDGDTDMDGEDDSDEEVEDSSDDGEEEPSTPPPPIELPNRSTRGKRMKEVRGADTVSLRANGATRQTWLMSVAAIHVPNGKQYAQIFVITSISCFVVTGMPSY